MSAAKTPALLVPTFYTVPEIQRRTRLGERVVREAIRDGRLRAVFIRPGGWPRVRSDDLERWLQSMESVV